jgi:hypothetical protein
MKELAAAITTRFNTANSLKTALGGQLYPYEAAQSAVFPYGVYYFIDENTDYDFSDERRDIFSQFSLFSESSSPSEAFTLGSHAQTLFDNAKMTLAGFDLIQFKRTGSRLLRDEEMNTYTMILEYHAIIERGR